MPRINWGFASDTVRVAGTPEQAFDRVHRAMTMIGTVIDEDRHTFVSGRTRYGLQRVSIKVFISSMNGDDQVVLRIEAFADDLWGRGARMGIRKLRRALGEDLA